MCSFYGKSQFFLLSTNHFLPLFMNRFLNTLWVLLLATVASAQTARVQIIHNSPSPTVDVYANGVRLLDDFVFRTATSFIDVPANVPISLAVAPASSMSVMEALATFNTTFESGKTYAVTASGVLNNTVTPFTLITDAGARESATASNKVSLNVLHGAPDAPAVDVVVRTGSKIVSNLAYGQFTPYLSVDPGVYYLDVKPARSLFLCCQIRCIMFDVDPTYKVPFCLLARI
jgi:hypothetical protein